MGRGKFQIKRSENSSNRQVTYAKRRIRLLKKARETSILCDGHVSPVTFAATGKMHEFLSPSMDGEGLLDLMDMKKRYVSILVGDFMLSSAHLKSNCIRDAEDCRKKIQRRQPTKKVSLY